MIAMDTSSKTFRAFADPTRLRLLNLLLDGELCVCDLCHVLDEIQPKVSRHLAMLRRAGMVAVRRQGKWKYYAITPEPDCLQRKLLECVRGCLRDTPELRRDLERLRTRPGDLCHPACEQQ